MPARNVTALDALQRLSLTIGTTLSLEQECAAFMRWLAEWRAPRVAALFVSGNDPQALEYVQGIACAPEDPQPLPVGYNPWEWLESRGVPLPPEGEASRYAFPLTSEGRVIGMVCLVTSPPLDDPAGSVLDIACTLLASAVRNIQRYESIEALVAERTAELRASEERYRAISETVSDFAYAADVTPEKRIQPVWVTDSFFRVSGYTAEELMQMDGWLTLLVEEDRPAGLKRRQRILSGQTDVAEFRIRYKDGSVHWLRDYSRPVWDEAEQRVTRIYGAAQDITAYREAQAALERRTAETTALLETARAITSLDLQHVLRTIARRAKELFQTDGSRIHLLEPDGKTLRCVVALHASAEAVLNMPVSLGEGFTGGVAQSGVAQIVDDTEADGRGLHVPNTPMESETLMLAPLKRGSRVIGVMTVSRLGTERPFSVHDLDFLQAFASQAAIAIANAQLYEKRERFAAQMQAINDLGQALLGAQQEQRVYTLVSATLQHIRTDIETIHIARPHPERETLEEVFAYGHEDTPSAEILEQSQRALQSRQVCRDERTLCIPLLYGEKTLGVLWLRVGALLHAEEDVPLLVTANLLAAALENLRLFNEVRHQLQHVQAVHMIARTINASVDMNVTLGVILKLVRAYLHADVAAVFLMEGYNPLLSCRALEGASGFYSTTHIRLNMRYPAVQEALLAQKMTSISGRDYLAQALTPVEWIQHERLRHAEVAPLVAKGQARGVLLLLYRAPRFITAEESEFLRGVARQTALGIEHTQLFEKLQHTTLQLVTAQDQILEHLALLVEEHNGEPAGDTLRMADLACRIAEELRLPLEQIQHLRRGILLHDLGMLLIPEAPIRSQQPLNEEQWALVRQHPARGYEFLKPLEFLRPALDVVRYHHERWDGGGYPYGLRGVDIPLMARIAAAADAWCALTASRLWRPALPQEKARQRMQALAGKALEAQVVELLLGMV